MRADWDVIVIGAGLAGLAAGATATRAGAAALVLEAHVPGGRARVTTRDGFVFNRGLHALYQALAGGGLHLLPASPDSLRRTTLLGRADKEAAATWPPGRLSSAARPAPSSPPVALPSR
jgi:phytoene dehydrogenase-like protein